MSNIGKRFSYPAVWEQPYFTDLDLKQRLFDLYLKNRCDLAGVFQLHFPVDSAYLGFKIDRAFIKSFIEAVNTDAKRIEPLEGQRLWLKGFVRYQQTKDEDGSLSAKSPPHKSIVRKLKEHGLFNRAIEDDPGLFSNYTGEILENEEPALNDSDNDSKGNARVSQGLAKGYSYSNDSNKGKSYGPPADFVNKAQSVLDAYPKKKYRWFRHLNTGSD